MKKTLTVNLGGTVYHIDEDAYHLLDSYLTNLRIHFRSEEGADEIVHDMELRISELFADCLSGSRQVITIEDVEEIITRLGKPEDLAGEDGPEDEKPEAEKKFVRRRLYRNPDNKVLGGVLGGLAAYFGWDPTWVRLAVLLFALPFTTVNFGFGHILLIYVLAWIVIPEARTATEKLAMRGEPVNVENIGKTVTDGFEKENDTLRSERSRSVLQRLGEAIVSVAGFLIKFLLVMVAICCAPVLFGLLVVCFSLLMAAMGIVVAVPAVLYEVLPQVDWSMVSAAPGVTIALSVAGILVIGIPVIGLIHLLMRHLGGWQPMSAFTKIFFIVLWFIAFGVLIFLLLHAPFIASMIC